MPIIEDEFSHIKNKQARFYFRKKKRGLCVGCGKRKPRKPYIYCTDCRERKEKHYRQSYPAKPKPHKHTARPSKYL